MILFRYRFVLIVLLSAFIAGFSLLHPGFYPSHDGEYHIVRYYEFDKSLREGNVFPRWAGGFQYGYGIPLFNFVYPLPNYAAFFFHGLGFSFIDSYKLQMFWAIMIGAILFYLWAKKYWGNWGGVISSVAYTFSPFHFVDVYIRGAVGEVWTLALYPGVFWLFDRFIDTQQKKYLFLSSILFSVTIFSHNVLALMFFPFFFSYVVFKIIKKTQKKKNIFSSIFLTLLGLGLAAIFWLPALYEKKFTVGLEVFDYTRHFPELYQLIIPSWGSGFSGGGLENEMSYQIGIINIFIVIFSLIFIVKRKYGKESNNILFFITWFFFVLFLMLPYSLSLWEIIPLIQYFQFPWRFLNLEIFISSFLAGGVFSVLYKSKTKSVLSKVIPVSFIMLPIIFTIGYSKPNHYFDRVDNHYLSRPNFTDGTNSPGNAFNTIWANNITKRASSGLSIKEGKVEVFELSKKSTHKIWKVNVLSDRTKIIINTTYFPGWKVLLDSYNLPFQITKNGTISVDIPKKDHTLELVYKDTPVRVIGSVISIISVLTIMLFLLHDTMKKSQLSL